MIPMTPEERSRKKELETEFEQLIRKRKFRKALRTAEQLAVVLPDDAEHWFKLHFAATLCRDPDRADLAYVKAKQCWNFTDELQGDFMRDLALQLVRQGKHRQALDVIIGVLQLHKADRNRIACAKGVKARAHFGLNDFAEAARLHLQADAMWGELARQDRPFTNQWQYNNLLPMLRAYVIRERFGEGHDVLEHLYERVVKGAVTYGTRQHVLRARVMRLGPSGVYIDMMLERLTRRW